MSQEEFIAYLKLHPGTTIKEVVEAMKCNINSTVIKAVLRDGLVSRAMEGRFYRYYSVVT